MIVVVLLAGRGTRTKPVFPDTPKPLIKIHDICMIDWVISNFNFPDAKYVFVVQKKDNEAFNLKKYFAKYNRPFEIVELNGPNEGAAVSALAAQDHYKNSELLLINADQYLSITLNSFLKMARTSDCDGMILTMKANGPKWSYVQTNQKDEVTLVAEKKEISTTATVGAYWFKSGRDFVDAAQQMMQANDRTNNEFYVAPSYNYMIKNQKKIKHYKLNSENGKFYGLGTAEDIEAFTQDPCSKDFAKEIIFE